MRGLSALAALVLVAALACDSGSKTTGPTKLTLAGTWQYRDSLPTYYQWQQGSFTGPTSILEISVSSGTLTITSTGTDTYAASGSIVSVDTVIQSNPASHSRQSTTIPVAVTLVVRNDTLYGLGTEPLPIPAGATTSLVWSLANPTFCTTLGNSIASTTGYIAGSFTCSARITLVRS